MRLPTHPFIQEINSQWFREAEEAAETWRNHTFGEIGERRDHEDGDLEYLDPAG
jgi:hypothetical protein